jgi:hypothetical protein
MGGAAGGCGFHSSAAGGGARHITTSAAERDASYLSLYGEGWQEATLKTLEQELKDRGLETKIGDDSYQVIPTPRLVGDRVSLGMVLALCAFLVVCACWAWWEYLPDDASPFYTSRTR